MSTMEPTVASSIHILAERPILRTNPEMYPSVIFFERAEPINDARLTITVTGDAEERRAFAARLREVADFMEQWTPASDEPAEPAAPSTYCPDCGDDLSASVDHVCVPQAMEA